MGGADIMESMVYGVFGSETYETKRVASKNFKISDISFDPRLRYLPISKIRYVFGLQFSFLSCECSVSRGQECPRHIQISNEKGDRRGDRLKNLFLSSTTNISERSVVQCQIDKSISQVFSATCTEMANFGV